MTSVESKPLRVRLYIGQSDMLGGSVELENALIISLVPMHGHKHYRELKPGQCTYACDRNNQIYCVSCEEGDNLVEPPMKTSKYLSDLSGDRLSLPSGQYEALKTALRGLLPEGATFRQSVDLLSQCFFAIFPDEMPEHSEIATVVAIELLREQFPFVTEDQKTSLKMFESEKRLLSALESFDL